MTQPHFTEPTTYYWQSILPVTHPAAPPPWQYGFPARLPDGRILMLPIRPLAADNTYAAASLLVNHASLAVVAELGAFLARVVGPLRPEVIIGLPTLGLSLAPLVAQELGLGRYIPLGYSRKFWYHEELSVEVESFTSPGLGLKRVYLDPNLLPLVRGKRVVIVDDAVSSGKTLKATWDLLESVGCIIEGCGVVMKQGVGWMELLGGERAKKVVGVLESPLLRAVDFGWDVR